LSYVDQTFFLSIQTRLWAHAELRHKRGGLPQDFASGGCMPGEIFLGNLNPAEFEALPLRTKRKGGPAYTTAIFGKSYEDIFKQKFEHASEDKRNEGKSYTVVFVQKSELNILGISY